jgi:hypothetical protein
MMENSLGANKKTLNVAALKKRSLGLAVKPLTNIV